jgi:hypothetical protein
MIAMPNMVDIAARWSGLLRWKRHFRLAHEGRLFATLDWETASGSLAVARSSHGLVVIERANPAASRVALRDDPRGPVVGEFVADWKAGGRLDMGPGRRWTWRPDGFGLGRWSFLDDEGRPALGVRVDSMRLMPAGSLTISAAAAPLADLPRLVALSWYLAVQTIDDGSLLVGSAAQG